MTFKQGETYAGFSLKEQQYIKEVDSDVYLFEHQQLGCPLLAIKNSDTNKTFSVAFQTIPTDSTGVAHILEHSVLMGSKKYPVKDVFGEINKGGLTTFLNAMTGADITYYPFATRNQKEYFNIMDVYCDVVFNPLLARSTFEQEGWHYHREGDSPLQYQGVVYNEMKGAFSDPIRHIFHNIYSGLMPGSTYAHESGGDPRNIPELSYEQFCEFHSSHYHPSNGIFFVYGDAPLQEELEFLQNRFLKNYQDPSQKAQIAEGNIISEPLFIDETYAVESTDLKEKTFLAVGTSVSTVVNREENTAFQIIANILFNSDGSPLKNAIASSGLCKDFGGFYLTSSSFRTLMITYLVGSETEHRDKFLELYRATLSKMVEDGLERDLIVSELNKFEFSFREDASKAQRGLDLISKAMSAFKYGTNPFDHLRNEALLSSIRKKALEEGYFEELIKKFLLDNPSRVTVTLAPDPNRQQQQHQEEQQRLADYDSSITEGQRVQEQERTTELMEEQLHPNSRETLALLPQLQLTDLAENLQFPKVTETEMFGKQVLVNELPTNHISYIDVGFDVDAVSPEYLLWLDLFGTIVTEIGTERLNFQQFAKETATCMGSFSHSLTCYSRDQQQQSARPMFWFQTKCLPDYMERSMHLLAEVFSSVSFADRTRIREIIGREYAWAEHSVQSEGYSLPATRVLAHLSEVGIYNELFSGVSTYLALKNLVLNYEKEEEKFIGILQKIASQLFNRNNLQLCITADGEEIQRFASLGSTISSSLPDEPVTRQSAPGLKLTGNEAFITAAEIVFAVQGGNLFERGEGYNGHFEVLKTYLNRDYLWNTVRQMGGAYGCFVQFGQLSGNIAYISYRDPQVKKTFAAYNNIAENIKNLELDKEVVNQLIIGTYGNFDPLQSSAAKGATARNDYFNSISTEYKRQRLQEIISTSLPDLRAFAPAFEQMQKNAIRGIIGNRKKIEADSQLFDSLLEL